MSNKISLKQFLMKSGRFENSSDCIDAIRRGKITINNQIMNNPSYFFNHKKSIIKCNNEKLKKISKLYFIMNKPSGFICQKSKDEKTIYDLLKKLKFEHKTINSLFAVGRLDKDTEGLLIITNDGKLSDILMNPESEIIKTYHAELEKPAILEKINMLEKGVEIEIDNGTYRTKKSKIKITGEKEVYIRISEGKKRQIRKMFEVIGNEVAYLKRISIGGLQLGKLGVGEIKQLKREEIYRNLDIQ